MEGTIIVDQIDDTGYDDVLEDMEKETTPSKKLKAENKKAKQEKQKSKIIDIEERERILLSQLLNNDQLFIKAIAFLQKDFFESKVNKLIIEFIKDYYEAYKSVPPEDAVLLELGLDDTKADWLDIKKPWPSEYLEDYLNAFIKNMSMKSAIEDSIDLLSEEDYGSIEKKIKDAVNVDIDVKLGISIENDKDSFRELFDMITSEEMTIPTGWSNLDKKLEGGVNVPSLNYLLGKSGGGKCLSFQTLINIKVSRELYEKMLMV